MSKMLKVNEVISGSQAEHIGIQIGDILVSYNKTPVSTNTELANAIYNAKNNKMSNVQIGISRDGSEMTMLATTDPLGLTCNEETSSETAKSSKGKVHYKTDYGVARGICSLVAVFGWVLVIGGFIVAFVSLGGGSSRYGGGFSLITMLPGLGTVVSGFIMIMGSQVTRATVDNADHTREILAALNRD